MSGCSGDCGQGRKPCDCERHEPLTVRECVGMLGVVAGLWVVVLLVLAVGG